MKKTNFVIFLILVISSFFYGNEYYFDEKGRVKRKSDVTGKPVFIISPPQEEELLSFYTSLRMPNFSI